MISWVQIIVAGGLALIAIWVLAQIAAEGNETW